jgi:hypothetical protein
LQWGCSAWLTDRSTDDRWYQKHLGFVGNLAADLSEAYIAAVKTAIVLLGVLLTVSNSYSEQPASSDCQSAARRFLTAPDEAKLRALDKSACFAVINSSNYKLSRLNSFVEAGNLWAAQYSAEHLKELDGGNLEDALIALGQFSNHDTKRFLLFAKNGLLSERELSDALTMLPLSLSDNAHAQLNELNQRRSKVVGVTQTDLQQQRKLALAAIDGFASEIRSKR